MVITVTMNDKLIDIVY